MKRLAVGIMLVGPMGWLAFALYYLMVLDKQLKSHADTQHTVLLLRFVLCTVTAFFTLAVSAIIIFS